MGLNNKNYLPYNQAKSVVQTEQIQSRRQYQVWWDTWAPKELPRNPNRVYKQWKGWPSFLGNNNVFKCKPKAFRKFEDALVYARQSGIKTSTEWMEYGNHPDDIPVRPDIIYKQTGEFKGWKHFLKTGRRVSQYLVKDSQRSNTIVGFLHDGYQPNNIYYIGTFNSTEAVKEFACEQSMSVVQLLECQDRNGCLNAINKFAFAQGDGFYVVPNFGELMFELSV